MPKFMTCFLFILLLPFCSFAKEICWTEPDWTLEISGAYFRPSSEKVRHVYSGWTDYQVQVSKRVDRFLGVWGNVNWMSKQQSYRDSRFKNVKNHVKMFALPLSVGCQWIYPILPYTEIFIGIGGCYSILNAYNHCTDYKRHGLKSSPFRHHEHKTTFGGIAKCGVQYALCNDFFVHAYVDYIYQKFHLSSRRLILGRHQFSNHLDLSGFKYGLGVGVYF